MLITQGPFEGLDRMAQGKAAEHLVCADLLLSGYRAFLSDESLAYDVLVDVAGRIVRVQVKSTRRAKNANARGKNPNRVYVFNVRRRGNGGRNRLTDAHCDLVALVALDTRQVAYLPVSETASTVSLYPSDHVFLGGYKRSRYLRIDELNIERALQCC